MLNKKEKGTASSYITHALYRCSAAITGSRYRSHSYVDLPIILSGNLYYMDVVTALGFVFTLDQ